MLQLGEVEPELDLERPAGCKFIKRSMKDKEAQGLAGRQRRHEGDLAGGFPSVWQRREAAGQPPWKAVGEDDTRIF